MTGRTGIAVVLAVQALCALFFILDLLILVLGLPPIPWTAHEIIEIGATVGLILGALLGGIALSRSEARMRSAESRLRAAQGAFMLVVEERMAEWGLTPAERDVALFLVKGMSTAEVAGLRSTSEGTVKAQTAAIYRKAGVSSRAQLLSVFLDDLGAGPVVAAPPEPIADEPAPVVPATAGVAAARTGAERAP